MDIYILLSVLSLIHCWILSTAFSAPVEASPTASQVRHVRKKRCSCATFLDKECVYFCHLDIIWVNTPERVVSYGLGNAPRKRRSIPVATTTESSRRCQCLHQGDLTCTHFCQKLDNNHLRDETSTKTEIHSVMGTDTSKTKRMNNRRRVTPPWLGAATKTQLLVKKWTRQAQRTGPVIPSSQRRKQKAFGTFTKARNTSGTLRGALPTTTSALAT